MKKTLLAFLCLSLAHISFGQMVFDTIPNGVGTVDLLKNHFLDDNMILVGANYYGIWGDVRTFRNGGDVVGLDSGIFLCTGNPDEVLQHPDTMLSADREDWELMDLIQDIKDLHPGEDAQILELFFIPVGDSVSFDFVLASEHFEGLECLVHLISEDQSPQVRHLNVSHVPGKPDVAVNSNTVNAAVDLQEESGCLAQDPDWRANSAYYQGSHPELAFNGFTKVISTTPIEVVPYQRYTLLISLSEGEDADHDSGLFLGGGSFGSMIDWPVQYEIVNTFFEFCDTLRVGELTITEEGAYFTRITPPYSPVDSFLRFQAYRPAETVNMTHEICSGDTLQIADNLVSRPMTIEEVGIGDEGCDSITIHKVIWETEEKDSLFYGYELCLGDTLFLPDTFLTNTDIIKINTGDGFCDTAIFYFAQFREMARKEEYIYACPGDTVSLLGEMITESSVLVDTLRSAEACDTLIFYHVQFASLDIQLNTEEENLYFCEDEVISLTYGTDFYGTTSDRYETQSFEPFEPIRDEFPGRVRSTLKVKGYGERSVRDLGGLAEICITLEHSWYHDLNIEVTAPNGNSVQLLDQNFILEEYLLGEPFDLGRSVPIPELEAPGIGYQYCWRMDASTTMGDLVELLEEGQTIPAGAYLPDDNFSRLNGSMANGNWKLFIEDIWGTDNGTVFDWGIRFAKSPLEGIVDQGWKTLPPGLAGDSLSITGQLGVGRHDLRYFLETEDGCTKEAVLPIQVIPSGAVPPQIDTVLCEPGFLFDRWIATSGSYQLTIGPPAYCDSGVTRLRVTIRDSIQADLSVAGDLDTYTFTVGNLLDEQVLIDFGDGQRSTERTTTHVYTQSGSYQPSVTIYGPCDTTTFQFQPVTVPARYQTTGYIETGPWSDDIDGISGVQVSANTAELAYPDQLTGEDGSYRFMNFWANSSFDLQPFKNDDPVNGLDIADLIRLSRHLNGSTTFSFPAQILAADLDCDTMITNQDLLELRRFLLEPGQVFPDSCASWIFWPQNYVLEEASTPFDHPVAIAIDSIQADTSGLDFYGVKRGDIGGNASAARGSSPPDSLFLRLKNGFVAADDTLRLDFRVENFEELVGFQVELAYDTAALAFEEVVYGEVPNLNSEHFGLSKVEEGIIRVVWLDILGNAHSLDDGTLAFGLAFHAKTDIEDRMNHLAIGSRDLSAVSFNAELVEGPVALKIDLITDLETSQVLPFELLQNRPNPFKESTLVSFSLPKACQASLTILNLAGQQVFQIDKQYSVGQHTEEIHLDVPGIYYYVLTTPWGRLSHRMVLTQ